MSGGPLPGKPIATLDTIIGVLARTNTAAAIAVPLVKMIIQAIRGSGGSAPDYTDAEVTAKIEHLRREARAGRDESERWLREHGFKVPGDPSG